MSASRRSSVWTFRLWAIASASRAWAREACPALSSCRLVIDRATGGPAAIVSTIVPGGGVELVGGDHRVDQSQGQGVRCADHPAGEGQLLRLVDPDALAEQPRGAEVEAQAPLGEDGGEPGPLGAPDHVGGQRQAEPGTHADAVDLGHHRHRAVVHGQHHVGQHPHAVEDVAGAGPDPPPSSPPPARSAPAQKSPPAPVRMMARAPE